MVEKIKVLIKNNKFLYFLARCLVIPYRRLKELIIKFIAAILPIKNNKIVFLSYYGEGYNDNPKYICDELLKRNLGLDLVWIVNDDVELPTGVRRVRYGTKEAIFAFASAKVWVVNLRMFMHPRKKKNQIYLQTWHGSYALKLIEGETEESLSERYVASAKNDGKMSDGIIAGDSAMYECMKNYFWLSDKNEILTIGNPKNDPFYDEELKAEITHNIKKKYSIDEDSLVVLFMPTFRNDNTFEYLNIDYEAVIDAFENKFSKNCVILVRLHPNVYEHNFILPTNEKIINVTDYPEGFDLMIASDYMISDFSGVIVNFALLKKCLFLFAPDYDEYIKNRGVNQLYRDIPVKASKTNEELIAEIENFDEIKQRKRWDEFFKKYVCFDDGQASQKAADWILGKMN